MNKYLMMSAAAVLATTAGANAGTLLHSFTFGTPSGGSYCDGGSVYSSGASIWAWQHTNNNCAGGVSTGQGLVGKLTALGYAAGDMSDNYYGNYKSIALNYTIPAKLKKGWTGWIEFSGTTSFEFNSGGFKNVTPGHKGSKSTTAALKTLIAAHRAGK